MNEQDLFDLKDDIEEAKSKVSELRGQQKLLTKEMKEDWKCSSAKEMERKIQKEEEEIKELDQRIDNRTAELEEKYEV